MSFSFNFKITGFFFPASLGKIWKKYTEYINVHSWWIIYVCLHVCVKAFSNYIVIFIHKAYIHTYIMLSKCSRNFRRLLNQFISYVSQYVSWTFSKFLWIWITPIGNELHHVLSMFLSLLKLFFALISHSLVGEDEFLPIDAMLLLYLYFYGKYSEEPYLIQPIQMLTTTMGSNHPHFLSIPNEKRKFHYDGFFPVKQTLLWMLHWTLQLMSSNQQ